MGLRIGIVMIVSAVMAAILLLLDAFDAPPEREPPRRLWEDASYLETLDASGKRGRRGIAVVAPASGLRGENVDKALNLATALGVSLPDDAIEPENVPYTATSDDKRLALLTRAMNDPEVEVLWALRGGYGSGRLLADLARLPPPETAKVFVGYSDMTFLHLLLRRWGWRTVHGPMFWELHFAGEGGTEENHRRLADLLAGRTTELRYSGLTPCNAAARDLERPVEAAVCGGNLTCLAAAVGSPWALEPNGDILFIEDVKEQGYKIDRMLTQLAHAGVFDGVSAVVLGAFTEGDDATGYALERFAESLDKPVFRTDQFGHGKINYPLVFNAPATIEKAPGDEGGYTLRIDARKLP